MKFFFFPIPTFPSRPEAFRDRNFVPKIFGMGRDTGQNRHNSVPSRIQIYVYLYNFFRKMHVLYIPWLGVHDIFFRENAIIIKFYLIMCYKMYCRSNIESVYLLATNIKCYILFKIDTLLGKSQINPSKYPKRQVRNLNLQKDYEGTSIYLYF